MFTFYICTTYYATTFWTSYSIFCPCVSFLSPYWYCFSHTLPLLLEMHPHLACFACFTAPVHPKHELSGELYRTNKITKLGGCLTICWKLKNLFIASVPLVFQCLISWDNIEIQVSHGMNNINNTLLIYEGWADRLDALCTCQTCGWTYHIYIHHLQELTCELQSHFYHLASRIHLFSPLNCCT